MSDQPDEPKVGGQAIVAELAPNAPSGVRYYSNNVQLSISQWDVVFNFNEVISTVSPTTKKIEKAEIHPRVVVTMSHEHAASFLAVFKGLLERRQQKAEAPQER